MTCQAGKRIRQGAKAGAQPPAAGLAPLALTHLPVLTSQSRLGLKQGQLGSACNRSRHLEQSLGALRETRQRRRQREQRAVMNQDGRATGPSEEGRPDSNLVGTVD